MSKINYKNTLALKYASSIFNYIVAENFQSIFELSLINTFDNFLENKNRENISIIQIVSDELRFLTFSIVETKNFYALLKDPTYSSLKKIDLIFSAFPNLSYLTKAFIKILGEKNHLYLLPQILVEYHKLLNDFLGIKYFSVIFSSIPKPNQLEMIKKNLSNLKLLKNQLHVIDFITFKMNEFALQIIYDPSILAGFIVYEGSRKIVDLSLKEKLNTIIQNI